MADENNEILIKIKVSEEDVKEKLIADRQAMVLLKKEAADLEKEFKAGVITAREYAQSQQAIKTQMSNTATEIKKGEKTLADYAKTQKSAEGSLEQMRAQAALLLPQIAALSKEERLNSAEGQQLVNTLRSLTDELKEQEKAYGSNQRNVGNYGDALAGASTGVDKLTVAQVKNKDAHDKSRKSVTDYIKDVKIMGVSVGSGVESFKDGINGVQVFSKAIFSARGALIALTAIPIVLVFSAIVAVLTKTQSGLDFIARVGGSVSAVFNVLIKTGVELAKAFTEVFTKPGDAIERFWRIIKGLPADLKDAAVAGNDVVAMSQLIREEERKTRIERAQNRAEVERLKKISEDVTKSQQERESAAQAAYAIESRLLKQQISTQQKRIKNIKDEIKLGQDTAEDRDKLADAEERLADIKEESLGKQTELQNQLNQIRIDGEKQVASLAVANAERALFLARESGQKTNLELFDLEKDLLDKKLALDLVGIVKGSEAELALRKKYQSDLNELNRASTYSEEQRLSSIRTAELKKRLAEAAKNSKAEFFLRQGLLQQEYLDQVSAANATIKNKEELDKKLRELDAKYRKDTQDLNDEQRQVELANELAFINNRLNLQKQSLTKRLKDILASLAIEREQRLKAAKDDAEAIKAINDEYNKKEKKARIETAEEMSAAITDAASNLTGTLSKIVDGSTARQLNALEQQQQAILSSVALSSEARQKIEADFQKKKDDIERKAAEKRRKIAHAENLIAIARGITESFKLPPPFNFINAALVAATGAAQMIVIDNTKYQKGGPVFGPSHAQGGIPMRHRSGRYIGEMEGGEIILAKGVYANPELRAQASALNVKGGGRPFVGTHAPIGRTFDMSHLTPKFQYGGVTASIETEAITNAIVQGMQLVDLRIGVDEITRKQQSVKRAEVRGDS